MTAIRTILAEDLPEPTVENIEDFGDEDYAVISLGILRDTMANLRVCGLRIPVIPDLDARIAHQILSEHAPGLDMSVWDNNNQLLLRPTISESTLDQVRYCGTTCCRGGHTILVAGPAAVPLVNRLGVSDAAAIIYYASTGRVPSFDPNLDEEEVFADILACAADQGWTP